MKLRDFTNTAETREAIRSKLQNAFDNFHNVHKKLKIDNKYNLKFEDVKVSDKEYHIGDQKDAIIKNKYLTVPITGKIKLVDEDGKEQDAYNGTIGRVPYYTGRGTFIYNGNEYTSSNQFRLKPGVYSRVKNSGDLESHVNVDPLTGPSFRINMNPKNGILKTTFGKANANLYSLLSNAGVTDDKLKKAWGNEIVETNKSKARSDELDRIYSHLYSGDKGKSLDPREKAKKIFQKMKDFRIDPLVTQRTIGRPYSFPTEDTLLRASRKILEINRGNEEPDDRDSLEFRTIHGPEDYLPEKIFNRKFAYNLLRQVKKNGVKEFPHNLVTKQLASLIQSDSRTQPIEETNPLEILDQQERFIVLGEGGISSLDSVPAELRNVHPSHLGLIDPVRGPESQAVGIDTRIAYGVKKGTDNHLYANVVNAKTGKEEYIRSDKLSSSNVGFPGEINNKDISIIDSNGLMKTVQKKDVDYFVKTPNHTMSTLSNLVPFSSAVQGNRLFMAGKILSQILPLKNGEAPIVRSKVPGEKDQSFDNLYGKKINGALAKTSGVVDKVTKEKIVIKSEDGKKVEHNLYNFFPFNRKTQITHRAIVKKGDVVKKNDILANTQYTDKNGTLNMGANLRVAFLPAKGQSYEDGIVISETAAKKLTSEHMYTYSADLSEKGAIGGKDKFQALFPTHYNIDQLSKISENGVIKVGSTVESGDPIILLMKKKELSSNDLILKNISKKLTHQYEPKASEWDHDHKGIVTDVEVGQKYIKVNVITMNPAGTGDKLTGRYGNKGVISSIWPDSEMPKDEADKPMEIMLNPMGLISRINPAQVYETLLGKVQDRGKADKFLVDSFRDEKTHEYISKILKANGIKDTDDLTNPVNGKKIKKILTGKMFILKPSKTGEVGLSARDVGTYSADLLPARGGKEGCFPAKQKIKTIDGNVHIAHIVEKRQSCLVWTFDDEIKEWVYKPVVDWFTYRAKIKDILRIEVAGALSDTETTIHTKWASCLYPTKNHIIYTYNRGKILAEELTKDDLLQSWGPVTTKDQLSFMLGTLLGDASVSNSAFQYEHSLKQIQYIEWKNSILAGLNPETHQRSGQEHSKSSVCSGPRYSINSCVYYQHVFKPLRKLCYPDGKKVVSEEWLKHVNDLGIAAWILDDGTITNVSKKKDGVKLKGSIATMGFDKKSIALLKEWLSKKIGETLWIIKNGTIALSRGACESIINLIANNVPYTAIPKSKKFLRKRVELIQKVTPPIKHKTVCKLGVIPVYIRDIRPYKHDKPNIKEINVYDIAVEKTHTYTAGSSLVSNSKRIGSMEVNALLAHNAVHNLRDAITIKGEKNDDFWRAVKLGMPLPAPKSPFMYDKFLNSLKAGGINTKRDGTTLKLTPMTDKDIMGMSQGEIKNGNMLKSKDLSTERDGLFDDIKTGGLAGQKWTHIDLKEKIPNPLFVDYLAKTLGMQEKEFMKEFSAKGGTYINNLLEDIDLDEKEKELKANIKKYKSTNRDNAIKVLRFVRGLKSNGKKLTDLMISKTGVLPPIYRPVSFVGSNMSLIADANNVYKDLIISRDGYEELKSDLPYESLSRERTTLFNALKAVMGVGDPISPKFKQQSVKGFLKQIYGNQPKRGMFQRKVLTKEQDLSGRAVAIPDPTLDMDQVGLPEKIAWKIYSPFVMRRLITGGMSAISALKEYDSRSNLAKRMLETEMENRPVIVNRAPTLHKYNIMSLYPKLRKDNVLAVPPIIEGGFNLDHDGDQVNIMLPATEEARAEAITTMLPSKNLLDPATLSAHYTPGHEAVYGVYLATTPKQSTPIRKFKTKKDAIEAYRKNEIEINDSIEVEEL